MGPILDYETPTATSFPTLSSATAAFAKGVATGTFLGWIVIIVASLSSEDADIMPILGCAASIITAGLSAGIGSAIFVIALALRGCLGSGRPAIPSHRSACLGGIACAGVACALGLALASAMQARWQFLPWFISLAVLSAIAAAVLPPKRT